MWAVSGEKGGTMKDMTVEELLNIVVKGDKVWTYAAIDGAGKIIGEVKEYREAKHELLRRFEELEKYNTKLLNEDIRVNNELNAARKRARDLECCGNCELGYTLQCPMWKKYKENRDGDYPAECGYCSSWTTDGLTRAEREK